MQFDEAKTVDLIRLVQKDLNRIGLQSGRWQKFECPFCKMLRKKQKTFLLVTNGGDGKGSWFVCKFCNTSGDAVTWVRKFRRISEADALYYIRSPRVKRVVVQELDAMI